MSKEGVKDLLEAIEPDYQSERVREQKQETISSILPTQTPERKGIFKRGIESLNKTKRKEEKLRLFNENKQKLLNNFKRVEESSNNFNNVEDFRDNINEILNYSQNVINFRRNHPKNLRNDSEFNNLLSNLNTILYKSKDFYEKNIGVVASNRNISNFKLIEKYIRELNIPTKGGRRFTLKKKKLLS